MRSTSVLLAVVAILITSDVDAAGEQPSRDTSIQRGIQREPASSRLARSTVRRETFEAGSEVIYGHEGDASEASGEECCDDCCDSSCGGKRCSGRKNRRDQASQFNCNCNGSYKFPVPPLYTYHWPGMFSQQLMTDYHSPWRFPAIRPYKDEKPFQANLERDELRQASHVSSPGATTPSTRVAGEPEPLSAKLRRYYAE